MMSYTILDEEMGDRIEMDSSRETTIMITSHGNDETEFADGDIIYRSTTQLILPESSSKSCLSTRRKVVAIAIAVALVVTFICVGVGVGLSLHHPTDKDVTSRSFSATKQTSTTQMIPSTRVSTTTRSPSTVSTAKQTSTTQRTPSTRVLTTTRSPSSVSTAKQTSTTLRTSSTRLLTTTRSPSTLSTAKQTSTTLRTPSTRVLTTTRSPSTVSTAKQTSTTLRTPPTSRNPPTVLTTEQTTALKTRAQTASLPLTKSEITTTVITTIRPTDPTTTPFDIDSVNVCRIASFSHVASPTASDDLCKVQFTSDRDAHSVIKIQRISKYIIGAKVRVIFRHGSSEIDLSTNEDMEIIIPKESEIVMVMPHTAKSDIFIKVMFNHQEFDHCDYVTSECKDDQWPSNRTMIQSCTIYDINVDGWMCAGYLDIDVGRYHVDNNDERSHGAKWNAGLMAPIWNGTMYEIKGLDHYDLDVNVEEEHSMLKFLGTAMGEKLSVRLLKLQ